VLQVSQPVKQVSQVLVVEFSKKVGGQLFKHYFPFKNFPLSQDKQSLEAKVVAQVLQPEAQGSQVLLVEFSIKLSPQVATH